MLLTRHPLFSCIRTRIFCWGVMEIVQDGARVESIDSFYFLRGKGLGLVSINKLEQLRKYIFDRDIERTQIKQVSNPKGNFVGIDKTFSI